MIPTVISRFESQADRTPDAPAATFQGATLSYAQLDARANGLAATLRERGVGPDVVVAVCVPRSFEMAVAVLGVLKAGGAYVPLDPAYPRERLSAMLDDARVQHVVAHSATAELVPGRNAILMDKDAPYPRRERLPIVAGLTHLAYVIFTSGSTGRPKGVAMIHHPLANLIAWQLDDSKVGAGERTLQFSPLAFDVSFQELFGTWCAGGELMLVDEALRIDTVRLLRFMKDERVARVFMPFIAMQSLAEIVPSPELTPSSLREMITAGEQLQVTPQLVRFFESVPGVTLANHYGPSETHVVTAMTLKGAPSAWPKLPSIGKALPNVTTPILDDKRNVVPAGEVGELYLGGVHLARGYLHRPELTAERFVTVNGERLYKTGDLARVRPDGEIDFLGRADGQVKIRGHRVELGEVEIAVTEHPKVRQAAATVRDGRLVAYMVGDDDGTLVARVRDLLTQKLPAYMVPTSFVVLPELPKTPSGKIDRKSLPDPPRARPDLATPWAAPEGPVEASIAQGWADILKIDNVGRDDNFFDLGGNSLLAVRAIAELREAQGVDVSVVRLYERPTVRGIAEAVASERAADPTHESLLGAAQPKTTKARLGVDKVPIAIVGMAARYPGARDLTAFWDNLARGVESIGRFAEHELPPAHRSLADYVPARGLLDGIEDFDASFFGVTPGEASVLDPQQRLLLELAWEALEHAGHAPERIMGSVGVFAGTHVNTYFQNHLFKRADVDARIGAFNVMVANEKDYVATRIAHRLSLTGPAISVHTACSTSLVAIAQAIDSLHLGHCDVALAGGAAVTLPQKTGHVFADGGIMSRDGSTRSFDAQGSGTVFSDGGGMVVLKRLPDAVRDGDTIYALLVGSALNNDGGDKASFMAPSSSGQSKVVSLALADAGVSARDIDYVEAHGTATPIGDPIEVEGLTRAYRQHTQDVGYCGLGSVKSNIGHTVAAAGVAGVIKTALALHHQMIPASLHYEKPNPAIDFGKSPFNVVATAKSWHRSERVRRAGVSSFGVGGTNAHVIMQEAPVAPVRDVRSRAYVLPISARNPQVLAAMTDRLVASLADGNLLVADVAATLALGRRAFSERRAVVASTRDEAMTAFKSGEARRVITRSMPPKAVHAVFMFPGQGSQTVGMGKKLYERFAAFRAVVDDCAEVLEPHLGRDLRELIWPASSVSADDAAAALRDTAIAQSALFTIELATATLWMDFGVVPTAMVGHSVGEFVAACLSGVFSRADGLRLVATRGRLMAAMAPGAMMSVRMAEADLAKELPDGVSIATVNAPMLSVVSGPTDAIAAFGQKLEAKGIAAKALHTSHAFHSAMMDGALPAFRETVKSVKLAAPTIPFASTVNGAWVDAKVATDVEYWATHLRKTVRFVDAMATIAGDDARLLIECGPRNALSQLARQQPSEKGRGRVVASLAEGLVDDDEDNAFAHALAQAWSWGAPIDWSRVYADDQVRRVALPSYPFDRKRHWVEPTAQAAPEATPVQQAAVAVPPPAQPIEESSNPMANSNATLEALKRAFEDVSGLDLANADPGASFFELGVDSLLLTQLALKVQSAFGVKVTFRQLTESFGTLSALVAHLEASGAGVVAARLAPAPVATPSAAPQVASAPQVMVAPHMMAPQMMSAPVVGGDPVRQLIDAQLRVMQQQLALLAGQPMASAPMTMTAPTVDSRPAMADSRTPSTESLGATAEHRAPAAPTTGKDDDEVKATQKYDVKKAFGAIARITTTNDGGLTPKQQARVDALTRRYTQKTAKSKAYTTQHRPHLADPRVVTGFRPAIKELVYQIVVERSKGCRLWDIDGNEYIDALNGFGSNFFGNSPDFIVKAIREQLDKGYELGPQHVLAGEVAKMFCELVGADRAGWCNTGSEAVMGALRVARTVTGRKTVAIFTGSYHGIFDEVLVRGTKTLRSLPAAPGIMPEYVGNVLVLDYGTDESLKIIRERAGELAAVMIEPIQSRRPDFAPREFVHALREITTKSGSALIFDEVITGLRMGHGGAQEFYGVKADIATYGKVIGGGMPIGVIAGKREWLDALDGGFWQFGDASTPPVGVTYFAGTFVRHPFALVAAKAVCEYLKTHGPSVQQGVSEKAARFQNELNAFFEGVEAPVKVKRFASLWKITMTSDQPWGDLLFVTMREKGLHILDGFPCFMTLAHTDADVDRMIAIVKEATRELIAGDLLPGKAESEPQALDANKPPVPGARLGKDRDGRPAWFVPNPNEPGKYLQVNA